MVQLTATGWWTVGAAAAGLVLGTAASGLTRRFLHGERALAGTWWLGALLTTITLGLLGWRVTERGELLVYAAVAVLAVPLAVIDWCEHRLPRALTVPQLAVALAGFAVLCLAHHDPAPGVRALAAMAAASGLFLLLAIITAGGIGAGDVVLAAVVGLITGWTGWPHLAATVLIACLLALAIMVIPGARRRDSTGATVVPFGPCLLAATLITVLASQ